MVEELKEQGAFGPVQSIGDTGGGHADYRTDEH